MDSIRVPHIQGENPYRHNGTPNSGRRRGWVDYICTKCRKPKRRHTRDRDRINWAGVCCLPCRRKAGLA